MAAMWTRKLPSRLQSQNCFRRLQSSVSAVTVDDAQERKSIYPPIKPRLPPGKWGDMEPIVAWDWYDCRQRFLNLPTVAERIHLMDTEFCQDKRCHKYWNFPLLNRTPGNLKYQQIMTKTVLKEVQNLNGIPCFDKIKNDEVVDVKNFLGPTVQDVLTEELTQLDRRHAKPLLGYNDERVTEDKHTDIILKRLLYVISTTLGNKHPHLFDMQITENVELSAHWEKYGIKRLNLPNVVRKRHPMHNMYEMKTLHRKRTPFELQLNSRVHASGKVSFMVRSESPLPEFSKDVQEAHFEEKELKEDRLLAWEQKVAEEKAKVEKLGNPLKLDKGPSPFLYPKIYGASFSDELITTNPGYNLGDPAQFSYMFIQNTNKNKLLKMEQDYGEEYASQAKIGWGMSTGFAWNVAMAHYQGFNSYVDITYPFTNFGILTDGRKFQFFANQLNTLELWKNNEANPSHNLCWYTPEMALYEAIEDKKLVNFDLNVLEHLITFLLCQPEDRGYDMKPTIPGDSLDRVKVDNWIEFKDKTPVVEKEVVYDESQLIH